MKTDKGFEARMKNIMISLCHKGLMKWEDYQDFGRLITRKLEKKGFDGVTMMYTPLTQWGTIVDNALNEVLMAKYTKH